MSAVPGPIEIICHTCGGTDVSRDAWADGDVARRRWVLRVVFDAAHCHGCEDERSLKERRVALSLE